MGPVGKSGTMAAKGWSGWANRPLLGRTDFRTQRLGQAAAVGTVTTILHLLILPVFVIQEGFKIGGTYKFVLYVSQDCHLSCPTVSKAYRHQLLQSTKKVMRTKTTEPSLGPNFNVTIPRRLLPH